MSNYQFFVQQLFRSHDVNPANVVIIDDNARITLESRLKTSISFQLQDEAGRRTKPCRWSNSTPNFSRSFTCSPQRNNNAVWTNNLPSLPSSSPTIHKEGLQKSNSFSSPPSAPHRRAFVSAGPAHRNLHTQRPPVVQPSLQLSPRAPEQFSERVREICFSTDDRQDMQTTKINAGPHIRSSESNRTGGRGHDIKKREGKRTHLKNKSLQQALGSMNPTGSKHKTTSKNVPRRRAEISGTFLDATANNGSLAIHDKAGKKTRMPRTKASRNWAKQAIDAIE